MHAVCVHVHVLVDRADAFLEATLSNARASVGEPGCLRFDVLRSADDPARFLLYEVYRDEAAAKAHKETAHYQTWRETVADWMAAPRRGEPYVSFFPPTEEGWLTRTDPEPEG